MNNITAVIVTFNRPELLIQCLNSVCNQSLKPSRIIIVDNNSDISTKNTLINNKFIDKELNTINYDNISITYCKKNINDGGAGGFNYGMKKALSYNSEFIWIMDDDGKPHKNCLSYLHSQMNQAVHYVAPNLIFEDSEHFTNRISEFKHDVVDDFGGPFNGILLSAELVENIGYPIKEFFIWGDEYEYIQRIKEFGYITALSKLAIFYHPKTIVNYKTNKRIFYLIRNRLWSFRLSKNNLRLKIIDSLSLYYFIFNVLFNLLINFNFKMIIELIKGIINGVKINPCTFEKR